MITNASKPGKAGGKRKKPRLDVITVQMHLSWAAYLTFVLETHRRETLGCLLFGFPSLCVDS